MPLTLLDLSEAKRATLAPAGGIAGYSHAHAEQYAGGSLRGRRWFRRFRRG